MRATAKGKGQVSEREQHRKAARLALDTSAHAGSDYHNFLRDSDEQVPKHCIPSVACRLRLPQLPA